MGLSKERTLAISVPLVAAATTYYLYRKNISKSKDSKAVPCAEAGMIETIQKLGGSECPFWMMETARKLGSNVYKMNIPVPGGTYLVGDADLALRILRDKSSDKPQALYSIFSKITGGLPTIFTSTNNDYWKFVRKSSAHAFSKNEVGRMISIAKQAAETLIRDIDRMIEQDQSFDPAVTMTRLTFDVILSAAFEYTPQPQEFEDFVSSLEICLREFSYRQSTNPLRAMFGILIPEVRQAMREAKKVQAFTQRVLEHYRANPNKSSLNNTLIRLIADNPDFPSDRHRIGEMVTFLIAGHDTTGFTISNTLILLAQHPQITQKLRSELNQVQDPNEWSKVEYYQHVMKESTRCLPVAATGSIRITGREFEHQEGRMIIPKGANVFMPQYVPYHDDAVFPDPERFHPDRWIHATKAMNDTIIPFSAGNRNCVGQALAKAEIDALIPLLVTQFDFIVEEEGTPDYFLTLKIAGAKLKAKRISA